MHARAVNQPLRVLTDEWRIGFRVLETCARGYSFFRGIWGWGQRGKLRQEEGRDCFCVEKKTGRVGVSIMDGRSGGLKKVGGKGEDENGFLL